MKKISEHLQTISKKNKLKHGIHSELHEFIDETREEWNDKLSFGRWLGLLKDVPLTILYQIRGSIRESNARIPAKLFFWKVKELKKKSIDNNTKAPPSDGAPCI